MKPGNRLCSLVLALLGFAYVAALVLFLIGKWGVFGATSDALSGVFLVLLGLPWIRFVDVFPEQLWPWLGALTPLINLTIVWALCLVMRRGSR